MTAFPAAEERSLKSKHVFNSPEGRELAGLGWDAITHQHASCCCRRQARRCSLPAVTPLQIHGSGKFTPHLFCSLASRLQGNGDDNEALTRRLRNLQTVLLALPRVLSRETCE